MLWTFTWHKLLRSTFARLNKKPLKKKESNFYYQIMSQGKAFNMTKYFAKLQFSSDFIVSFTITDTIASRSPHQVMEKINQDINERRRTMSSDQIKKFKVFFGVRLSIFLFVCALLFVCI